MRKRNHHDLPYEQIKVNGANSNPDDAEWYLERSNSEEQVRIRSTVRLYHTKHHLEAKEHGEESELVMEASGVGATCANLPEGDVAHLTIDGEQCTVFYQ